MPSNKKRLYVAVYPSGVVNNEERKYHWAFIVGPKDERGNSVGGTRYHVKNVYAEGWMYEEVPLLDVRNTVNLLARVLIAKIEDESRLLQILRDNDIVQNDPNWRCRTWVSAALDKLSRDGKAVGTSQLNWQTIETVARRYVGGKAEKGRYKVAENPPKPRPLYDLLENKEIVP